METRELILEAIQDADLGKAIACLNEWGDAYGYESFTERILLPVLEKYTLDDFKQDGSPLAQGYVAARFAEIAMETVLRKTDSGSEPVGFKGPVVIGNIEDDFHSLGRRIVIAFLKTKGWKIIDLGNDVPAHEFVAKAMENEARIIAASAMMYSTAVNISGIREEIIKRNLESSMKLAVGGAIFNLREDLIKEVGGDGTARSALQVPALFDGFVNG